MTGRIVGIALAAGALLAPSAQAADYNGALDTVGSKFEWADNNNRFALGTGQTAPPVDMCADPGFPCVTTLLNVKEAGTLDIEVVDTGLVRPDVDIYLYASDKDGAEGDLVGAGETPSATEAVSAVVEPGFYLLKTAYFSGVNNNSTGKATLNPLPPPEEEF